MAEDLPSTNAQLTNGRLLARNSMWSLAGLGAPLVVAAAAIPPLLRGLGVDRFGILTLAWVVVGYFGLMDFGLGRALTKFVAEKVGTRGKDEIPALFWTALLLITAFGLVAMALMAALAPWMVLSFLKMPFGLRREATDSFYILAVALPVVISSTALRGFLESYQRFELVTAVRLPLGVLTYGGPVLVLPFSRNLVPIAILLVLVRYAASAVYLFLCFRLEPALFKGHIHIRMVGTLVRYGAWMSVSNSINPLMAAVERIFIGSFISVAAVAYYATPYEVISKLLIIPGAIVAVLFPAFSATFGEHPERSSLLLRGAVAATLAAIFPIVLVAILFSAAGLQIWVGTEFASHAFRVLQFLAVGLIFNSVAQVPYGLLQGIGRPDLTGKLHMVELPVYLIALYLLVINYGIVGASVAWTGRVAIDCVALFYMAARYLPDGREILRRVAVGVAGATLFCVLAFMHMEIETKVVLLWGFWLAFMPALWFGVLRSSDRTFLWLWMRRQLTSRAVDVAG